MKQSDTGNVKKRCDCGRKKWSTCAHPWHVDYKAPKDHPRRPNERYRKNLDTVAGTHAENLRDAQNEARRAITAWLDGRDPTDIQPGDRPTLAALLEAYHKRPGAGASEKVQIGAITRTKVLGRPFGEWFAASVTRDALNAFRAARPPIAANRNLAVLRACFNWAIADGLLSASPFRVAHVAVVKLAREESRTRRLRAGEEERLLEAALTLRDIIVAALETGMRCGELLSLQWHQVGTDLFLPAGKTKAKKPRRVPITSVLRTVLDSRRNDPAGEPLPVDAYVFGNEIGQRRGSIDRAWQSTLLRANGIKPAYVPRAEKGPRSRKTTAKLTQECREALRRIDLHFHDLRREAGSRWMDAGVPLATIQRWLGHHNISQTSKYLAASLGGDESTIMEAFERKVGRVTQRDISAGSNGLQPTSTDQTLSENTEQNTIVH